MTQHSDEISNAIPAYALKALEADEAERVERHLATCQHCQAELAAYEAVTARLAGTLPIAEPPAALKQKLMRRIGTKHAHPPVQPTTPTTVWERLQNAFHTVAVVWIPASLIIIVALLASNMLLWRQSGRAPFRTVALSGTAAAPEAGGVLIMTPGDDAGRLVVNNLEPLPESQQYQLWLIKPDGSRDSGALFSTTADGKAEVLVSGGQKLSAYQSFGITIEPRGGSPGPTGQQVMGSH